jgi:hypothetical protein
MGDPMNTPHPTQSQQDRPRLTVWTNPKYMQERQYPKKHPEPGYGRIVGPEGIYGRAGAR